MRGIGFFAFLSALCVAFIGYAYLAGAFDDLHRLLDWRLPLRLLVVAGPLFIWFLYSRRHQMIRLDYHTVYIPFVCWLAAFFVLKMVTWPIAGGRAFLGPYGADKGAMNFYIVEPPLVFLLSGLYLLRFPLSRDLAPAEVGRAAMRWMWIIVGLAFLVAILVPPLGE